MKLDLLNIELVNSPNVLSVDVIASNTKTSITYKDYTIIADKQIYFELCYGPMLNNSDDHQEIFTLAHQLHIKRKSKNIIVSSGAVNTFDLRNPHDVMHFIKDVEDEYEVLVYSEDDY